MAIGACPPRSPPEVAVAVTRGLLSMLQPKSIVVITELHEQAISKSSLQEAQHEFYGLSTSQASVSPAGLHPLPAGCCVTDMAAAVLSAAEVRDIVESVLFFVRALLQRPDLSARVTGCGHVVQARGIPAVAVVSIAHQAFAAVTRKHLLALASKIALAVEACAPELGVTILQQAACEAPLRSPWEAPRVYL